MKYSILLLLGSLAWGQKPPTIIVEAWRIEQDYMISPPNLMNRYSGRWVIVTGGTISGISEMESPKPECALEVMINRSINACVAKDEVKWVARAKIGQEIRVACMAGPSYPDGEVYLNNCLVRTRR